MKCSEEFAEEGAAKLQELLLMGNLKSELIQESLLNIPREIFIPQNCQDYACHEVPLPLPCERSIIPSPHIYPLFHKSLGLEGDYKLLEIDTGSGYSVAVAREVVGAKGHRLSWNP